MLWLLSHLLWAHPFSTNEYSVRTAMKVSDKGVALLVAMEIPITVALEEIGAKKEESKKSKQKKIKRYTQQQWDLLAKSLRYTVDGKEPKGRWRPIEHPANGKAAEGFFVYLVGFQSKKPLKVKPGMTIVVENNAYPEAPMVYTASAHSSEPWRIAESTSKTILGEKEALPLAEADRWSRDAGLRTLTVVVAKDEQEKSK
ncbi:MAG: hypothetical protein VX278_06920 [Myxococcota bacterium]|nr:hypothetical protein [Myxococcota bacterium]